MAGKVFRPSYDETVPVENHTEIFAQYGIDAKTI